MINFLSLDPYTNAVFEGIVMKDFRTLPNRKRENVLYVLNTDVYTGPGEHWCVVYFKDDVCEFFDPFGLPPEKYGLERVINTKSAGKRFYNSVCVQDLASDTCGPHCLFFSYHRCRGYLLPDILNLYKGSKAITTDEVAEKFVLRFGQSFSVASSTL